MKNDPRIRTDSPVILLTAAPPVVASDLLAEPGRQVFFDATLSESAGHSCASCHSLAAGCTGPDSAINTAGASYGGPVHGRSGNRKPPSAACATLSPPFDLNPGEAAAIVAFVKILNDGWTPPAA